MCIWKDYCVSMLFFFHFTNLLECYDSTLYFLFPKLTTSNFMKCVNLLPFHILFHLHSGTIGTLFYNIFCLLTHVRWTV